jgi:hypothetical protein
MFSNTTTVQSLVSHVFRMRSGERFGSRPVTGSFEGLKTVNSSSNDKPAVHFRMTLGLCAAMDNRMPRKLKRFSAGISLRTDPFRTVVSMDITKGGGR